MERRYIYKSLGKFKNKVDAEQVVKGKGCTPKEDGIVEKVTIEYQVYETVQEYKAAVKEQVRLQALAKLTDEERAV